MTIATTKKGRGRPKLPDSEKRIAVKIRLHPEEAKRLRLFARGENLSMGKFVGQLIDAH